MRKLFLLFTLALVNVAAQDYPRDPFPRNGTLGEPLRVPLEWRGESDSGFVVWLGTTPYPQPIGHTETNTLVVTNLRPETTYYWRVTGVVDGDLRASPTWTFTTGRANHAPHLQHILAGAPRPTEDGMPARDAVLTGPTGAASDGAGNVYFIDGGNRVRRVGPDGRLRTVYRPASGSVQGIAVSAHDLLFIAMPDHIVRISRNGEPAFYAGEPGVSGFEGEGELASRARFHSISGIAVGRDGTVYVADAGNGRVRAINPGQTVVTLAGTGECGEGERTGEALQVPLCAPSRVAAGADGTVYVLEGGRLLRIAGGVVEPVAPELSGLREIASTTEGTVIAADASMRLHRMGSDGSVEVFAGNFEGSMPTLEGSVTDVRFVRISGLAFDPSGNLFVTDAAAHHIRRLDPFGAVERVAGADPLGVTEGSSLQSYVSRPSSIVVDSSGIVYVADAGNNTIRRISPSGAIQVEAGAVATAGFAEDTLLLEERVGADARTHRLDLSPGSVMALDPSGQLWFTHNRSSAGDPSLPAALFALRDGKIEAALDSQVPFVGGMVFAPDGTMYFSDTLGHRVLKFDEEGNPTPVAGTGTPGRNGDKVPAVEAELRSPRALMYTPNGYLYIAEAGRVRRVSPAGEIETFLNENVTAMTFDRYENLYFTTTGYVYAYRADTEALVRYRTLLIQDAETRPVEVVFRDLSGIAVGPDGDIYLSDAGSNHVSRLVRNVPRSISVAAGGNQTIPAGQDAPDLLRVRVQGSAGYPVEGVTVRLTSFPAGALGHAQTALTDSSGTATFRLRAVARSGEVSLQLSVAGLRTATTGAAIE